MGKFACWAVLVTAVLLGPAMVAEAASPVGMVGAGTLPVGWFRIALDVVLVVLMLVPVGG